MKQLILIISVCLFTSLSLQAQKYFTRAGKVSFTSEAPLEKIEAHNSSAMSVIDLESGNMEFAVLIKAFQFKKALMQEHFNENYLESDKYPKATFKGSIKDFDKNSILEEGEHSVTVTGTMTIHGVSKEITADGKFTVNGEEISANSVFDLEVADYDIEIPGIMNEKIAKTVTVAIDFNYEEYKSN